MRELNEEESEIFMTFSNAGFSGQQSWVLFALVERLAEVEWYLYRHLKGEEDVAE